MKSNRSINAFASACLLFGMAEAIPNPQFNRGGVPELVAKSGRNGEALPVRQQRADEDLLKPSFGLPLAEPQPGPSSEDKVFFSNMIRSFMDMIVNEQSNMFADMVPYRGSPPAASSVQPVISEECHMTLKFKGILDTLAIYVVDPQEIVIELATSKATRLSSSRGFLSRSEAGLRGSGEDASFSKSNLKSANDTVAAVKPDFGRVIVETQVSFKSYKLPDNCSATENNVQDISAEVQDNQIDIKFHKNEPKSTSTITETLSEIEASVDTSTVEAPVARLASFKDYQEPVQNFFRQAPENIKGFFQNVAGYFGQAEATKETATPGVSDKIKDLQPVLRYVADPIKKEL